MKKFEEYYLGLDMGTGSVGWAVTNPSYNVIKRHGKALWGIRLFESANTAEERRAFRISRRRTERRKERLALLQEIFAEEICKRDAGFYQRMKESKYWHEDKLDINGNMPELPYALFADDGFTDKDYYKKYPTIYHLRYALVNNSEDKPDIRLVYLALHHIIKYRGHFLFEGKKLSEVENFSTAMDALKQQALEQDIDLSLLDDPDVLNQLESIICDVNCSKSDKKTQIGKLIAGTDKQKKAIAALITGCTVKLNDIFPDLELDKDDNAKVCFSDNNYEEKEAEIEALLADRFLLITAAKCVYDWTVLHDILSNSHYLSEAKVKTYQKHCEDLRKVKKLLRADKEIYEAVFGVPANKEANYSAYIGMVKKNGKKQPIEKTCTTDDFYKFLKGKLDKLQVDEAGQALIDQLKSEMEMGTLFPKQRIRDNGVIPYQLHENELNAILENASKFYPFLLQADPDGHTPIEKIQKIFRFRIPYYVGPLNTTHKDKGGHSWSVRKKEGKIYPWNFTEMIDEEESATKFIERMTNKCSYLIGEDVLPKESLLYAKFNVLNELNNLRIDGELVSVEIKQLIYNQVFQKYQHVTGKKLKDFLLHNGIISKGQELSGFDQNFKSSLKAYHDFKQIVGAGVLTQNQQEDIVRNITLFGDSQPMLRKRLRRKYPALSDKQVQQLASRKYTGWGRLSRTFLEEIESVNKETGEIMNIITALWETNDNLMQLLSGKYDYITQIEEWNAGRNLEGEVTYQNVEELYVSPAVKRPIWQTIRIVKEVAHIMGGSPKRIFVEMAKEPGEKGVRKVSRRNSLLDLYKQRKKEAPELYDRLANKESDNALRSDKLYLYYSQMGKCMYSNEAIDLNDLFTNRYDIDHIYPQSKVMDDSLDNRVLVKRELNSRKSDNFPVPKEYVDAAKPLWDTLLSKKLISKEKYKRLTRRDSFGEEELAGFIARQLVETRQSTKAVTKLLATAYPESEIVYSKAKAVSEFRHKFDALKVRDVNDYHHAKDAYLNIVVGNTYYVKFTKDAAWFIRNNPGRSYNLKKMFENETVKRGNETAWIPGDNGTVCVVKKWLNKNNILFTRQSFEEKGKLFEQTIVKKGKGQIPLKNGADKRLQNKEKYGAYNKASGAYYMLVESDDKKGGRKRSIEVVPVYLTQTFKKHPELLNEYCENELKLINADIRINAIKKNTLFQINKLRMHLSSRTGDDYIFTNATQLILAEDVMQLVKCITKYCDEKRVNKNCTLSSKNRIKEDQLILLYDLLLQKLDSTIYQGHFNALTKALKNKREKFIDLATEEKYYVINEILHPLQCNSKNANLTLLEEGKTVGRLRLKKTIKPSDSICIINQSITGFYEQVIDLQTI